MATGPGHDEQLQGAIGERELLRLAQEARLHAMKAVPDLGGWDYCVEEAESPSTARLDLRPPGRRWMVQVKTVHRLESSVSIKLANWQRMATQSVPWFVLVVEVVNLQPKRSFLVHIGEYWIAKTLERLVKLRPGAEARLNKLNMGMKFRDAELIPSDGPTFVSALRRDAGSDPATYAAEKDRLVKTVGYDEFRYRGTMRVGFDGVDQLAEFAVGLRDSLPARDVTVDSIRFGIPLREFEASEGALTVLARPVSGRARVTHIRANVGTRCSLEFDVVQATRVIPEIPSEHERAALRHPIVQIYLRGSDSKVDIHYKLPESKDPLPLADIGPASEFVAIIADASPTDGVQAEVQFNDGPVTSYTLRDTKLQTRDLAKAAIPIANAWEIARRVGLEHVHVLPWELYAQRDRLFIGRAALESRGGGAARLRDLNTDQLRDGPSGVVGASAVRLGDTVCIFGISVTGLGRIEAGQDGKPEAVIDGGTFRAHGIRMLSRAQFDAERNTLQRALDDAVCADLDALGVVNMFVPKRDGQTNRLLLRPASLSDSAP